MLDDFMALSRVVTGVEDLDVNLGRQYLNRLASSPFQPQLDEILGRFRGLKKGEKLVEQVKAKIVEVDLLRPTVCQIILLWYTSTVQDNLGMDPPAPSLSFAYKEIIKDVKHHPHDWIAQRRFDTLPLETCSGVRYACLGIFTLDGQAVGAYGRIAAKPLIDHDAQDIAVLIRRKDHGENDRKRTV